MCTCSASIHMFTHAHARTYTVCVGPCIQIYAFVCHYMNPCVMLVVCVDMYLYTCVHMCMSMCAHVCLYTCAFVHVCACVNLCP